MKYNVIATYDNAEITVKTNDLEIAITELMERCNDDVPVDLIDGYTGEVLVSTNTEEPYATEEWSLILLGWLMCNEWGEPAEPAPAEEEGLPPMVTEALTEFAKSLF